MPSCERPYSLYTTLTGSPGQEVDAPELITLRGDGAAGAPLLASAEDIVATKLTTVQCAS
jgi:hypothetical protein